MAKESGTNINNWGCPTLAERYLIQSFPFPFPYFLSFAFDIPSIKIGWGEGGGGGGTVEKSRESPSNEGAINDCEEQGCSSVLRG